LKRVGFLASPADHLCAPGRDLHRPSDFRISGQLRAVGDAIAGQRGGNPAN
jgi:hypothetical protein